MPGWKSITIFAAITAALGVATVRGYHEEPEAAVPFDASLQMTSAVKAILTRSCADCHAVTNHLPWYAHIPPASWMVESDIARAKKAVNLTDWSHTTGKTPGLAMGSLAAMCADVQSGRMPDKKYLWMHPDAKLSPAEVDTFCGWTAQEMVGARKRK